MCLNICQGKISNTFIIEFEAIFFLPLQVFKVQGLDEHIYYLKRKQELYTFPNKEIHHILSS